MATLTLIVLASAAAQRNPIANNAEWSNGQPVALSGLKRPKLGSVFPCQFGSNWTYSQHPIISRQKEAVEVLRVALADLDGVLSRARAGSRVDAGIVRDLRSRNQDLIPACAKAKSAP